MDQISPPMRIVLAVAVVFLAAYMLVLKPKDEVAPEPAATPATPATASATDDNKASTRLGKAVEGARGAAAATEAKQDEEGLGSSSAPSTSATTPSTGTRSAPGTTAATPVDESLAKLPTWLQESMDKKVVAILFTNGRSADDRRTRAALKHAFTAHGQVVKRAVPIAQIAKYRPVAQGVDVQQSPTMMVIDRRRQAQTLVGYSNVDAVNQAIIDGLLATDVPVRKVEYLQTVRAECRQVKQAQIIGPTSGESFAGAKKNLDHAIAVEASSLGTLRNAPAPARYRPLKKTVNAYVASELSIVRSFRSVAVGGKSIDQVKVRQIARRNDRLQDRAGLELAAVGINACT